MADRNPKTTDKGVLQKKLASEAYRAKGGVARNSFSIKAGIMTNRTLTLSSLLYCFCPCDDFLAFFVPCDFPSPKNLEGSAKREAPAFLLFSLLLPTEEGLEGQGSEKQMTECQQGDKS